MAKMNYIKIILTFLLAFSLLISCAVALNDNSKTKIKYIFNNKKVYGYILINDTSYYTNTSNCLYGFVGIYQGYFCPYNAKIIKITKKDKEKENKFIDNIECPLDFKGYYKGKKCN